MIFYKHKEKREKSEKIQVSLKMTKLHKQIGPNWFVGQEILKCTWDLNNPRMFHYAPFSIQGATSSRQRDDTRGKAMADAFWLNI
jgi:hypothetical protein